MAALQNTTSALGGKALGGKALGGKQGKPTKDEMRQEDAVTSRMAQMVRYGENVFYDPRFQKQKKCKQVVQNLRDIQSADNGGQVSSTLHAMAHFVKQNGDVAGILRKPGNHIAVREITANLHEDDSAFLLTESPDVLVFVDAFKRYFGEETILIPEGFHDLFRTCAEITTGQIDGFRCLVLMLDPRQRQLLQLYITTLHHVAKSQAVEAQRCKDQGLDLKFMGDISSVAKCVAPGIFRKLDEEKMVLAARSSAADCQELLKKEEELLKMNIVAVAMLIEHAPSIFDADMTMQMLNRDPVTRAASNTPKAPRTRPQEGTEDAVGDEATITAMRGVLVDMASQAEKDEAAGKSKEAEKTRSLMAKFQIEIATLEGKGPGTPPPSTAATPVRRILNSARKKVTKMSRLMSTTPRNAPGKGTVTYMHGPPRPVNFGDDALTIEEFLGAAPIKKAAAGGVVPDVQGEGKENNGSDQGTDIWNMPPPLAPRSAPTVRSVLVAPVPARETLL